jgi:hypothetical protein
MEKGTSQWLSMCAIFPRDVRSHERPWMLLVFQHMGLLEMGDAADVHSDMHTLV